MSQDGTMPTRRPYQLRTRIAIGVLVLLGVAHLLRPHVTLPSRASLPRSAADAAFIAEVKRLGGEVNAAGQDPYRPSRWQSHEVFQIVFRGPGFGDRQLATLMEKGGDRVRRLALLNTSVTDAGLASLHKAPHLGFLSVASGPGTTSRITDLGLKNLEGLNLGALNLAGSRVTDAGLEHLRGMSLLTTLHLDRTLVRGPGLAYLEPLRNLMALSLDDTTIDDEGLKGFADLTQVRGLMLNRTRITAAGLKHLEGLYGLMHLHVVGNNLTREDVGPLKTALPAVNIFRDADAPARPHTPGGVPSPWPMGDRTPASGMDSDVR